MAIPQTKYINIISAVGGTSQVSQRDLMGRVFTSNPIVPYGAVIEFTGLDSVGKYFGITSNEYIFAQKYFGYVSKSGNMAQKISFALHSSEALPARLYGASKVASLAYLQTFTSADFAINVDGTTYTLTGLDLSSVTSFADVAALIQGSINTQADDTVVSVEYNALLSRFVFETASTTDESTIGYGVGDLAVAMGVAESNVGSVISDGSIAETGLKTITDSAALSNNFYSFTFLTDVSSELTDIAAWVKAQNVRYMWSLAVTSANASTVASALSEYDGVGLSLGSDLVFLPMAIAAAVNYDLPNASVDYMYQQASGITTTVDNQTEQEAYDAIRVNYYGSTQQGGGIVSFYQDGKLLGSIASMGVYANEAWLKDAMFTNLLNLRLSLDSLPANESGLAYVKASMQEIIEKAQNNGVISVGKTLDATQKAYINQITGDKNAWQSIQSIGYWLSATVEKYTEAGTEKYKVTYLLVYAKGDSINYVDGKDIMI